MGAESIPKDAAVVAPVAAPAAAVNFDLTLGEFCQNVSAGGKFGPELLGGFHHEQKAAGNHKSSHDAYAAALDLFANKPV